MDGIGHRDLQSSNVQLDGGPPCLANLPPELMEHIANHVTPSDLPSLRLVSREMNAKVFRAFSKALFSDRAFLLSNRSSMNMLYAISRHKTFARDVEHIRFSPLTLRPVDEFKSRWEQEEPVLTKSERMMNSQVIGLSYEMKIAEEEFLYGDHRSGNLHGVLRSIFSQFKHTRHYPDISFIDLYQNDGYHEMQNTWGLERLREALKAHLLQDDCMRPALHNQYHEAVYKTMSDMQYAPKELDIGQFSHKMALGVFSYRTLQFPGRNLRTLRLTLTSWTKQYGSPIVTCPIRRQELQDLATVLANIPQLANLKLHAANTWITLDRSRPTHGSIHRDIFHCLATKSHLDGTPLDVLQCGILLPRLESLDLANHAIGFDLFLRFCSERRETLRQLKLVHIIDYEKPTEAEHRIRDALGAAPGNGDVGTSLTLDRCFEGRNDGIRFI